MSKIEKLKAIHNYVRSFPKYFYDVVTMSKIEKLKAIHNALAAIEDEKRML